MNRHFLATILATGLLITSCKEGYKTETGNHKPPSELNTTPPAKESFNLIDVSLIDKLNQTITNQNLRTEEEIMNAYKAKNSEVEGNYSYSIEKNEMGNGTEEVTLIEEGIPDDSQAGLKVIMTLKKESNNFKIISIKENYKCWKDRGHEYWSAELCN